MSRCLVALPALALAACAASPASDAPSRPLRLDYTICIANPATERVEVELALAGLPANERFLTLALPERFAFVGLDAPVLAGPPEALDGAGRPLSVEELSPFRWRVERGDVTEVRVRLAVPLTHRAIPAVRDRDSYEFPYLAPDHGMLVAGTMLLAPEGLDGSARVRFDLPEGWAVRCPWPQTAPGVYEPASRNALQDDLLAVGFWEERVIDANGCEVTVAVAPGQGDLLEQVSPHIERIVHAEIDLFGCVPREKYLFLFGRPDPPPAPGERGLSLAGSPKDGSMTLMVRGVGLGIDPARHVGHLIAHEFFHTWAQPHVALPDELRFVGEGFTDYYAWLVLAREGLISWEEFAVVLQEKLRDYLSNPTRGELSLASAGGPRFFEGGAAYAHVYDGGMLFAALVDRAIRAGGDGRSLDEMLRAFFNDPRWRKPETQGHSAAASALRGNGWGGEAVLRRPTSPTFADFFGVLSKYLPGDDVARLAAMARSPEGIDFARLLSDTGAAVTSALAPLQPNLRANLDGTRIRDIDPGGLGARLGLRAGDVLLEINGVTCDEPDQVHRAWRAPLDGRMRFVFTRAGERHEVDAPLPEEVAVSVDAEPWRAHLATTADR